jgi:replicative DNA helicase
MGLERNFSMILNCMLSKKLEYRKCKYPRLSDLKKFHHFVVEADQVVITYYPHTYLPEQEPQDHWEMRLIKNRNGPCSGQYFTEPISVLFQEEREGNGKEAI